MHDSGPIDCNQADLPVRNERLRGSGDIPFFLTGAISVGLGSRFPLTHSIARSVHRLHPNPSAFLCPRSLSPQGDIVGGQYSPPGPAWGLQSARLEILGGGPKALHKDTGPRELLHRHQVPLPLQWKPLQCNAQASCVPERASETKSQVPSQNTGSSALHPLRVRHPLCYEDYRVP